MRPHLTLAAASLTLAAILGACSAEAGKADQSGSPLIRLAPESMDAFPIRIGAIRAAALRDGGMSGVPNDNEILGVGQTPEAVAAVLTANGLRGRASSSASNPCWCRMGGASS